MKRERIQMKREKIANNNKKIALYRELGKMIANNKPATPDGGHTCPTCRRAGMQMEVNDSEEEEESVTSPQYR